MSEPANKCEALYRLLERCPFGGKTSAELAREIGWPIGIVCALLSKMGKRGTLFRDPRTRCWMIASQKDAWSIRRDFQIDKIPGAALAAMRKEDSLRGITEDDLRWMREKSEQAAKRQASIR